jgi:hypothetical protein
MKFGLKAEFTKVLNQNCWLFLKELGVFKTVSQNLEKPLKK